MQKAMLNPGTPLGPTKVKRDDEEQDSASRPLRKLKVTPIGSSKKMKLKLKR
jgi:hypothetical protein